MEWIKLELKTLRSDKYLGCDPVQRATYISLLGYCADQENSGVISDCAGWGDRKWMSLCGVTKSEVSDCELFSFSENGDLSIYMYPISEQNTLVSKRESGRAAANKRWEKHRLDTPIQPTEVVGIGHDTDTQWVTHAESIGDPCEQDRSPIGSPYADKIDKIDKKDKTEDTEAHPSFELYSEGHTPKYNPMSDTGLRVEFAPYIEYRPAQMDVILGQLRHIIGKTSLERTLKQAARLSQESGKKLWADEFMRLFLENCKAHKQSEERNA